MDSGVGIGGISSGLDATRVSGDLLQGRISALNGANEQEDPEFIAREMESLFSTLLVRELRRGLASGFFGSGPGADTYAAWLDEELGSSLANTGALDLAGRVKASIEAKARDGR